MIRFTIACIALVVLVASGLRGAHTGSVIAAQAAPSGKAIFETNCATCHQAQGDGLPDAVPPLAKNAYVSGNPKAVIHTVLYGKKGPIKVNGKPYDATMPAWKKSLKPGEIAAVITFIRTSFGNKGKAVTEKQVLAVKK